MTIRFAVSEGRTLALNLPKPSAGYDLEENGSVGDGYLQ